jgi:hypothetical protein
MYAEGWSAPGGSQGVLSPKQVDALFTDAAELSALDPRGGPLPAVLDADFIRTGLHHQLKQGKLPMSVWSAAEGSLRLFMEYDTLVETEAKLPKFARQFGVSWDELQRILSQEWLPKIDVVCLPLGYEGWIPGPCESAIATRTTSRRERWPPYCRPACCSPTTTSTSAPWAC